MKITNWNGWRIKFLLFGLFLILFSLPRSYGQVFIENGTQINNSVYDFTLNCSINVSEFDVFDTNITINNALLDSYNLNSCQSAGNSTNSTSCSTTNTGSEDPMIAFILLYALLVSLGMFLIIRGIKVTGYAILGTTIGMDFYLIQYYYHQFVDGFITSDFRGMFIFLFAISTIFWIMGKCYLPIEIANKHR